MEPTSTTYDSDGTEDVRQLLENFVYRTPGATLALLTSGDGFEIAAHPHSGSASQRLAAMSSSLQALSEAMVNEAGFEGIRNLIIESKLGTVLVLGVGKSARSLSLTVVASGEEFLGHLLWSARECCLALERRLLTGIS